MSNTKKVSQFELALLVLGYLEKNGSLFPQTLKSFKAESKTVLGTHSLPGNSVKDLEALLNDYLHLTINIKERGSLISGIINRGKQSEDTFSKILENTLKGISCVVEDYMQFREHVKNESVATNSSSTLAADYRNGAIGAVIRRESESYNHNISDNDDLGLPLSNIKSNRRSGISSFVTPLRHDRNDVVSSSSCAKQPGIVSELMNRFSETASNSKRKKKYPYRNGIIPTTETETPATDYDHTFSSNLGSQEQDNRLMRDSSTSSPQAHHHNLNFRRRKSHKPRKLITPKSGAPVNHPALRDSTESRRADIHHMASIQPPEKENSTISSATATNSKNVLVEGDSQLSNMSAFLNTDSDSIFPPELEDKLMHDQDLHQKLADEINKGDGMSVSGPVIDDILSNILNNFDSNFEPRTTSQSQISPTFLRQEKMLLHEHEFAVPNDNTDKDSVQNRNTLKSSKAKETVALVSKSPNPKPSKRAKLTAEEEQNENENQEANQNVLPADMDVDKFLDSIKYD